MSSRHFLELSEIQKATNNFDVSLLLKRGYSGDVYYGELFNGPISVRVAIKRLDHDSRIGPTDSWPDVERQSLYTLRHPNLVSFIGYCIDHAAEETIFVYEYISGRKTLSDHLHLLRTPLSWIRRLEICIGVARGLQYLHTAGVMHGDVRSSNILLTQSLAPKLTDYGLSQLCLTDGHSNVITLPPGAFGYVDRFFVRYGRLTMESDVYSLGVLLLELLCGRPVIDATCHGDDPLRSLVIWSQYFVPTTTADLQVMVDSDVKHEISTKCLEEYFEISKRCMLEYSEQRPGIHEVVAKLESLLLQERLNNSLSCPPSVKELTFDDLEKATRGFSQNPLLGDSAVFLGWVDHDTLAPSEEGVGIAVAVKSVPPLHDDWLGGVNFLGQLVHPNIIRLLGCCCSKDGHRNLLVYEHMPRSLSHFIHGDDRLEPLSWGTRLNIMIGVARGMAFLYTDKGLRCNFQCDDVLLDEDFNAKIGGFRWEEIQQTHDREQLKGVFGYLNAEYDTNTGHLPMNDVRSFGLVLLETITAKHQNDVLVDLESLEMGPPWSKSNEGKLQNKIDRRLKGNYSSNGAFSCMALALRCIDVQHKSRPSWEEIVWNLGQINALNK